MPHEPDNLRTFERANVLVIEPHRGWARVNLRELWAYRELLYFLVWRDVKVRYKQTVLGAAWAIIQPFMTMVVFSVVFGWLAKMPSDGLPYPVFAFAALVPWGYFSSAISSGGNSLVGSGHLISKVYFPRLIIPMASVLTPLVDFGVAFLILLLMGLWYGIVPGLAMLWVPVFIGLAMVTALATSLWFAALNVEYRDVRYVLGFLTQFWLYASPVAYPASLVPERWRLVYGLNPLVGVIEGFRWALLGAPAPGPLVLMSSLVVLVLLVTGLAYFRRMEGTFADVI